MNAAVRTIDLFNSFQRKLQVSLLVSRKCNRIDARVARRAIVALLRPDGTAQTCKTQIGERVGLDSIEAHPDYDEVSMQNDLALLRLAAPTSADTLPWATATLDDHSDSGRAVW